MYVIDPAIILWPSETVLVEFYFVEVRFFSFVSCTFSQTGLQEKDWILSIWRDFSIGHGVYMTNWFYCCRGNSLLRKRVSWFTVLIRLYFVLYLFSFSSWALLNQCAYPKGLKPVKRYGLKPVKRYGIETLFIHNVCCLIYMHISI